MRYTILKKKREREEKKRGEKLSRLYINIEKELQITWLSPNLCERGESEVAGKTTTTPSPLYFAPRMKSWRIMKAHSSRSTPPPVFLLPQEDGFLPAANVGRGKERERESRSSRLISKNEIFEELHHSNDETHGNRLFAEQCLPLYIRYVDLPRIWC